MQRSEINHYATLGLDHRCTAAQIRAAYRLLAKVHHPDLNSGSPDAVTRFQALNVAHETLSDPAQRLAYDRELEAPKNSTTTRRTGKIERTISRDLHLRPEEFLSGSTREVRVNDPANPHGPEFYALVIPPHTAPGTRFRLPRAGQFADGFVQLRVRALPGFRFKVRGSDLRCDLKIQPQRAAQGGVEMTPGMFPPTPAKLGENCARVTGNRSPTKKVAGFPSSVRSKMRRPCCTSESISEKLAAAPGSVARNVVEPPPNAISGGNAFDIVQHKSHEAVALALHARHDFAAIDAYAAVEMNAETGRKLPRMHRFSRCDQEFARHAADARTGRTVGAAFDQDDRCTRGLCRAIRSEPGRACTDDGDVDVHVASWSRCHWLITNGSLTEMHTMSSTPFALKAAASSL